MDPSAARSLANDWLRDFCLALKNVSSYSEQHPRGKEYLERAYESLRLAMGQRREVVLVCGDGRLYLDQILLDRERGIFHQLAVTFAERGVEALILHATLTPQEHVGFIRALLMKPDRIAEKGGFGQTLLDEGVASIKTSSDPIPRGRRPGPPPDDLIGALIQENRGANTAAASALLRQEPQAVVAAIEAQAGRRDPGGILLTDAIAEVIADTLERLADKAMEEHQWNREEILDYIGRVLVAASPALHHTLFLEKAGSRSVRKYIIAAVEGLPPDAIGDLVGAHRAAGQTDHRRLGEILSRTNAWRDQRQAVQEFVDKRLAAMGVEPQERMDLFDHLAWAEASLIRRLDLLSKSDHLWRADFTRIKEVLVKLMASGQVAEASAFIRQYLGGLQSEDLEIRRMAADNSRHLLQLLEKSTGGSAILGHVTELFFTRLQEEQSQDVVSRLAGGLAYLTDLRLRTGELSSALELLRRAEALQASSSSALREKGEKLAEALGRIGNDRIFNKLSTLLLDGEDASSLEAAEILKRSGNRSANFLIERLAEEENRSHRARLVMLLKEMGKGSSAPFLACLEDPRWFLVRNVVGILGDIGDSSALPHVLAVAAHSDPRVRREVIRTLTRLTSSESEERIIEALRDEDRGVQITAVTALATVKGVRSAGVMFDLARRAPPYAELAPAVRIEAIACLGRSGAKEAFPVLAEILTRRGFLGPAESPEVRSAAVKALGVLGTPEALELVTGTAAKESKPAVREAAQEVLKSRSEAATTRES